MRARTERLRTLAIASRNPFNCAPVISWIQAPGPIALTC
jgi:hypothetical protein